MIPVTEWYMKQLYQYLLRNLENSLLNANPARLTLMFSFSPRYSTWCFTLQVKDKGQGLRAFNCNKDCKQCWPLTFRSLKGSGVCCHMIIFRSLKGFGVCWHMIIFRSLRGSGVLPAVFKVAGSLGFIGFDTSYIVGGTLHQSFYQLVGLSLNHQKTTNIINKILYHLNKW